LRPFCRECRHSPREVAGAGIRLPTSYPASAGGLHKAFNRVSPADSGTDHVPLSVVPAIDFHHGGRLRYSVALMPMFPPSVNAYVAPTSPSGKDSRRASGRPDEAPSTASPARLATWLLGRQWKLILLSGVLALVAMLPGVLAPLFIGLTIDHGIAPRDLGGTLLWSGALVVVILAGVAAGAVESGAQDASFLSAMYRVMMLVSRKVCQLSHSLTRAVPVGEVLTVASIDAQDFGVLASVAGRALAALASLAVVATIVLKESVVLGLITLGSAPVMMLLLAPIMRPQRRNQIVEREQATAMTNVAVDIVSGLRVLNGIGGEAAMERRYQ